jgi:2-oxoglutarate ferredoxin oxidoreductase subunit gamma
MQKDVMFAGFGGQGILLSGKILAVAAMEKGLQVAWIPSYGPEMRGGTAYCTVVISEERIGSPVIQHPAHLVAMNLPSLEKFSHAVKPGGVVLINSSLIDTGTGRSDVDELRVPTSEIAVAAGSLKAANIVALGAFVARSRIMEFDLIKETVKSVFAKKAKFIPMNLDALERGRRAALEN